VPHFFKLQVARWSNNAARVVLCECLGNFFPVHAVKFHAPYQSVIGDLSWRYAMLANLTTNRTRMLHVEPSSQRSSAILWIVGLSQHNTPCKRSFPPCSLPTPPPSMLSLLAIPMQPQETRDVARALARKGVIWYSVPLLREHSLPLSRPSFCAPISHLHFLPEF
jgi:hypothetical protein